MRPLLPALIVLLSAAPAFARRPPPLPSAAATSALDALTTRRGAVTQTSSSAYAGRERMLGPGEEVVLGRVNGPAVIDRIWIGVEGAETLWRDLVLTVTYAGAAQASVESPLGDFFGLGPGARIELDAAAFAVRSGGRSLTSLWKMPVATEATVSLRNDGAVPTRQLLWEVNWHEDAGAASALRFHARYVQADPAPVGAPWEPLRLQGRGQLVGVALAVQNAQPGPWGTGDIAFSVDGSTQNAPATLPLLAYLGHLFGVERRDGQHLGTALAEGVRPGARNAAFRLHVQDPVPFDRELSLRIGHGTTNERNDRFGAVIFWYQEGAAAGLPALPAVAERRWETPSPEALAKWRRADEIDEEVVAAYRRDDYDAALSLLVERLGLEPDSVYANYNVACLYALKGDEARALHHLEEAWRLGFSELSFARNDPDLASLHGNERFERLTQGSR